MKIRQFLILAAALAYGALGAADLSITFQTSSKGLGSGSGTEMHYYTSRYQLSRNEKTRQDNLTDFQKGMTYAIDHKKKTIETMSMVDAMTILESFSQQGQGQPEGLGAVMGAMFGDPNEIKLEKLGTETVAGRTCQKYSLKAGKLTMELSADPSLRLPVPEGAYAKMMQAKAAVMAKSGPMGASFRRLYQEMAKIKGVPLKTHLTGFMMNVTTEATKVEEGPVSPALFDLPGDYRTEDMGRKLKEELKAK